MRHILAIIVFGLCLWASPLLAQDTLEENRPTANSARGSAFEGLKRTGSGRVDRVIDATTITLKDGKIVRLSAIDVPGLRGAEPDDNALLAFQLIQKLLPNGTEVALYQTRDAKAGRTNRMGQTLAHLHLEKDNIWLQGALLSVGLARAMPTEANPQMIREMLALETKARAEKKGIWADNSPYRLYRDTGLTGKTGTVQVVEGKVLKAASVKNNLYLNFGSDWRTDFTVRVTPETRRQLSRAGIDPMALTGKTIRARGYIEEYNGPMITLETIHHLEILDETPSAQ